LKKKLVGKRARVRGETPRRTAFYVEFGDIATA
jgi:hypothetical protein